MSSKIATVAIPLIKRALAGVAVFSVAARASATRGSSLFFQLSAPGTDMGRTLKWRMVPPGLNHLCRAVSLSVYCDKRKEKKRLFIGAGSFVGVAHR